MVGDGSDVGREVSIKFSENGIIVGAGAFKRIMDCGLPVDEIISKAKESKIWFLDEQFLEEYVIVTKEDKKACKDLEAKARDQEARDLAQQEGREPPPAVDVSRPTKDIPAKGMESRLVINEKSDVTGKSTCSGSIDDFVDYFNARYAATKGVLQERMEYKSVMTIADVIKAGSSMGNSKVRIICMVSEKRTSDKNYKFLDVEDPTGELTVFISDKNPLLSQTFERVLMDEVIGVEGTLRNKLFIASEITQPDIPLNKPPKYADENVYAAFISDIHVGSYLFLEREFQKFIDWISGSGNKREIADSLKYIFVAGDLVDGVGIYPTQESELTIPDVYKQYDFLSMLLEQIPSHIEIVLSMGNHDAVRNAEPQPRLSKDMGGKLFELPNVHVVGNPIWLSAHDVDILMYHGTSLDMIISNLSGCSYSRPETAMIEYLKRRNLIPMYGVEGIAPEKKDYLFIKDVPDIFHCGHVHTNGYTNYHGVHVLNSGTWQSKTKYQEQLGHTPTPARVPVINLRNHDINMLYFGE